MRNSSISLLAGTAFLGLTSLVHANTIDLSTASLTGGARLQGGGSQIFFAPNQVGTATFAFFSVPSTQYTISVAGQINQSPSFFEFLVDAKGPGPGGFVQLGSDVNFHSGLQTITSPTFTDLGPSGFFRIQSAGRDLPRWSG